MLVMSALSAQTAEIKTLNRDTIQMGDILKGDTVRAVFRFRIEGDGRLKIRQVHPGCQCTVPVYPADSLSAGAEDSVVLEFHSRNVHEGEVEKYAIVINTGTEKIFYLKGNILPLAQGRRKPRLITITNK